MSLDIASMLKDLLETEEQLKISSQTPIESQTSLKSVTFQDTVNEEITQPKTTETIAVKSILKTPTITVMPTEVPLPPTDYNSEDYESESSSESDDSLDFQSDG